MRPPGLPGRDNLEGQLAKNAIQKPRYNQTACLVSALVAGSGNAGTISRTSSAQVMTIVHFRGTVAKVAR
jgi:hypothetical protein